MQQLSRKIEDHFIDIEPYYLPQGDEVSIAMAAHKNRTPLLLKGPTGSGKSRFMQYLAWRLQRPLITVSCHDDLTSNDLVGRYLIRGGETFWVDGPLTMAVRSGAICYLDEIVEARKDTTVVIHPLADDRREMTLEKKGELLSAPDDFMLAVSYNPGYQSLVKDMKQSTRQRFIALELGYPPAELEEQIVAHEAGIDHILATSLVKIAAMTRNLKDEGLQEGASTRLLIHAGQLIKDGIAPRIACQATIAQPLSDEAEMQSALQELISSVV